MIEPLSFEELIEYVPKDYEEFISDGLNPNQAISRLIVEYEIQTDEHEDVKLLFCLILAKICVKHSCLRDEIIEEALEIIKSKKLLKLWMHEGVSSAILAEREELLTSIQQLLTYKQ